MKQFAIAYQWEPIPSPKPKLSPQEIRKQDRRKTRHDEKRKLKDESKAK